MNVGSIVQFRDPDSETGKLIFGHVVNVYPGPLGGKVMVRVAGRPAGDYLLKWSAVTVARLGPIDG